MRSWRSIMGIIRSKLQGVSKPLLFSYIGDRVAVDLKQGGFWSVTLRSGSTTMTQLDVTTSHTLPGRRSCNFRNSSHQYAQLDTVCLASHVCNYVTVSVEGWLCFPHAAAVDVRGVGTKTNYPCTGPSNSTFSVLVFLRYSSGYNFGLVSTCLNPWQVGVFCIR